jgi:hypothetical protein
VRGVRPSPTQQQMARKSKGRNEMRLVARHEEEFGAQKYAL